MTKSKNLNENNFNIKNMIIKETTKLEYLKGIQNKNIFQNNENNKKINKEYLEKEIKVFHKIKLINT